ncbi:MAG: insulinase family protein, partial [Nitrospirae bacterium]
PNTIYRFDSGGDPDAIPELTQEKFLSYHSRYYHPSNSFIYLYGDGDVLEHLAFIDREYLKDFDYKDIKPDLPIEPPFNRPVEMVIDYPISSNESPEEKTFLSINFSVGRVTDPELYLAFDMLEHMLLETPAAPLKKVLLQSGIGKDVFGSYDNSILQPSFSVVLKYSEPNRKDELHNITYETLKGMVEDGIDKKLIEASVNIKEFGLREGDYRNFPKGLFYGMMVMDSWPYGGAPYSHLMYGPTIEKIRASSMDGDYFERLIEDYILKNLHRSTLIVKPKQGLEQERAKKLRDRLRAYKASLKEDEINRLIEQTRALKERQSMPDRPEDLAKIPILPIDEIKKEAEVLPCVESERDSIKLLFHPMFTNNIIYIDLYFDTSSVPQRLLPYISLLSSVMGRVSTEKYNYMELSKEINIHTGGIHFMHENFSEKDDDASYYPKLTLKSRALTKKLPKLSELIAELISGTRFDEKHRLKEILQEIRSRMEASIMQNGHVFATKRLLSYFSLSGRYNELVSGLSYYRFITDLE